MTNEELNTALYKKVFAEAFVKERNEALFSLDRKKIEAYMIKYRETEIARHPMSFSGHPCTRPFAASRMRRKPL